MTKQNIDRSNIVLQFGDGSGNIIAIGIKTISKNGSVKYELYGTDNNLSNFEFLSSSGNPYDFDAILYKNSKGGAHKSSKSTLSQKQSKKLF